MTVIRCATTIALLALAVAPARAETVYICWQGDNGYTMSGRMDFPDALAQAELVTEADVTGFAITGYLDGEPLGSWNMKDRAADTTWYLRYLPQERMFPVDDMVPGPFDQGWNADGTATDCGNPGFGFNAGSNAQDFCVNGVWIVESGMPPPTPFYALTTPPLTPDCSGPMMMSKRGGP